MAKIIDVEGIGEKFGKKLIKADVSTTNALLKKGATPKGRDEIAKMTGISSKLILTWVNHVDLFRIKGVGEEYADLLESAGVDTVPELGQRNAENLRKKLDDTNQKKKLVRQLPSINQVTNWVKQAKKLPRIITY